MRSPARRKACSTAYFIPSRSRGRSDDARQRIVAQRFAKRANFVVFGQHDDRRLGGVRVLAEVLQEPGTAVRGRFGC